MRLLRQKFTAYVLPAMAAMLFLFGSVANAALTDTAIVAGDNITFTCTDPDDYVAAYQASSLTQVFAAECPYVKGVWDLGPGNFHLVAETTDLADVPYNDAVAGTPTEVALLRANPNFTPGGGAGLSITQAPATGFVGNVGAFLTTVLPFILLVFAALIGLGFLLTRVKRWIGRRA